MNSQSTFSKHILKALFLVLIFNVHSVHSQVVPNIDWVQNYSEKDQIENVPSAIDANNNVYVTGYTLFNGSIDYTTLKYDPAGTLLWVNHYNGTGLGIDRGNAITLDNNGNVYVTGESDGVGSGKDYVTVKYSASGTELWAVRYNGTANGNDEALDLTVDNNGNVYVTGRSEGAGTGYDYVTIKYSSAGIQQWIKRYNGSANGDDQAIKVVKGNGNRLFVTGTSFNNGSGKDIVTIRYNASNGSGLWVNTKNGTANQNDYSYDLITNGANIIVVGSVFQLSTNNDYYVAKINGNNGSVIGETTYNQGDDDFATDVIVDGSGDIVVTGIAKNGVAYEYQTVNYSNTLSFQWVNKESLNQPFYRIYPTLKVDDFDHFYVCGERSNNGNINVLLYQITPSGNTSWDTEHDGTIGGDDVGVDMVMGNLGEIYLTAQTQNSNAKFDYTTIKYVLTPVYFPIDFNGEVSSPLFAFYENKGQIMNTIGNPADNVLYSATYPDFNFFLHDAGVSMVFESFEQGVPTPDTIHRVDLQLIGANPNFSCYNYEDVPLKKNYYLPHLPNGASDVTGYNRLFIPNIYPNIDLHFYNNNTGLKYYFVVKPGGNPSSIRLAYNGATSTTLNGNNDLTINTSIGSTKFTRPKAYRITPSLNTVSVGTASWNAIGNDLYNFNLPNYNTNLPLIIQIDQGTATNVQKVAIGNLLWSTYYGGSSTTSFQDVKNDDAGNTYITGHTESPDFPFPQGQSFTPIYSGGFDAVVIKLNNLIEPQWITYFGGATPFDMEANEFSAGIVVSGSGDRIYIGGETSSTDMPIVDGGGTYFSDNTNTCTATDCVDGFIARFDANGQLIWSTYYGVDGDEGIYDLALDFSNNLYAVGYRNTATNLVNKTGASNYTAGIGLILEFDQNNQLLWANSWDCQAIYGVDTDINDVYITGLTESANMPVLNSDPAVGQTATYSNAGDAFVAKFSNSGQLAYSFYYGGNCVDIGTDIGIAANGKVFIGGSSPGDPGFGCANSSNLPVVNGFFGSQFGGEAFILRLDRHTSGNNVNILNASYFGSGGDEGMGIVFAYSDVSIAVRNDGYVFLSGNSQGDGVSLPLTLPLPVTQPLGFYAVEEVADGVPSGLEQEDAFIAAFDPNFNLVWTTYFGGEFSDGGSSISVSQSDNRLYFVGNTNTRNNLLAPGEILLPNLEFDDTPGSNDYYQEFPNAPGSYPSWAAMFDLTGIEIPDITNVEELSTNTKFTLYPNPNNGSFMISGTENIDYIEVIDLSGRLVQYIKVKSKQATITLQGFESGIYFARVHTQEGIASIKFIKE